MEYHREVCRRERRQDHRWEFLAWEPRKTQDTFSLVINLINGIIFKPKLEEHLQDKIIDFMEALHFRVETPDLWVVMVGQGVHRQGSMGIRDKHLVRQVVIREIQVSQVVIKEIQDKLYRHNNNNKLQSKQGLRQEEKYQAKP